MPGETDPRTTDQANQSATAHQADQPAPSSGTPPSEPSADARAQPGFDLSALRELILRAHPDVVPEMITGDSFDSLLASVDAARAAYRRIVESVGAAPAADPQNTPNTGAGTSPGAGVGTAGQPGRHASMLGEQALAQLSPAAKIAEGVRRRSRG